MLRAKEWPYGRAWCVQEGETCHVAGVEDLGLGRRFRLRQSRKRQEMRPDRQAEVRARDAPQGKNQWNGYSRKAYLPGRKQ